MKQVVLISALTLLILNNNVMGRPGEAGRDSSIENTWHFYDPVNDSIAGISLFRAYELLGDRKSTEVIVAIIDTGVDKDHEDLKNNLWVNPGEISDNGIDDDKNGYIDDIHGWNFNGGPEQNVAFDNMEVTREYTRLKTKYAESKKTSGKAYAYWFEVMTEYKRDSANYFSQTKRYQELQRTFDSNYEIVKSRLPEGLISVALLKELPTDDHQIEQAVNKLIPILETYEAIHADPFSEQENGPIEPGDFENWTNDVLEYLQLYTDYFYNQNYNPRSIVGDVYTNVKERIYGNNQSWNYSGKYGYHGTHVAGIVGAVRGNGIGMDGIADNVKIMSLRACSTGDERDKDVANAIRYAADNGARVMNMSFGKFYSPQNKEVHKAIKYAEKKGVIMVHGAGNEKTNVDLRTVYPNPNYSKSKKAKTWINVGANYKNQDADLTASFTNFGMKNVDLFAPGVNIYSTMPKNQYQTASGTSMASPVVAGVAALLFSYFPEFDGAEIRDILVESSYRPQHLMVHKPGTNNEVDFKRLSQTGGIVNAYLAVQLALQKSASPGK